MCAALGQVVERRTPVGAVLSAPLVSMLLALAAAAIGLLPTASAAADAIWSYLMPLGAACYLLESDLTQLFTSAGATLMAFVIGAVGTVVGTIVAFKLVGPQLGPDGYKVAAALCASYIGGSLNFAAVSQGLALAPGPLLAGAMTADNCAMALYIATIMSIPAEPPPQQQQQGSSGSGSAAPPVQAPVSAESVALSVAAAALSCALGTRIASAAGMGSSALAVMALLASGIAMLGSKLAAGASGTGSSSSTASSSSSSSNNCAAYAAAAAAATPLPAAAAGPFAGAEALGGALMMLFFATIGAAAGSLQALQGCGWLLLFIVLQLSIHLGVCLVGGRLLRLPMQAILIASNANVGGPATAAAMASSKGWQHMIQPAMLTGALGYAVATAIGVSMGHWMSGWYPVAG